MAVSDKLYELRKKSGLSQEALAEQLDVSRQAVSKWESGQSTPEPDKLVAISRYFGVSLDYLMKDDAEAEEAIHNDTTSKNKAKPSREKLIIGLIFAIGGAACLIIWGLISIISPTASESIGASSMISLDGNGIFLVLCAVSAVFGAVLLLSHNSKK